MTCLLTKQLFSHFPPIQSLVILNSDKLLCHISEGKDKQIFWDIVKDVICLSPEEKYRNPAHIYQPLTTFVLQSTNKTFLNSMSQYVAE